MNASRFSLVIVLTATCLVLGSSRSQADLVFTVQMDTSSLQGVNGPYYLDYQLNDGGGGPDGGNNSATIGLLSGFQGLGTPLPNYGLGVSGGFSSSGGTLTLTDLVDPSPPVPGTGGINEYTQQFTPGNSLAFQVHLTTNPDSGSSPDQFLFSIYYTDATGSPQFIPTISPLGYSFVSVSVDSASPSILAYGSDGSTAPPGIDVPEPTITILSSAVPEPPSAFLLVNGFLWVGWRAIRGRVRGHG